MHGGAGNGEVRRDQLIDGDQIAKRVTCGERDAVAAATGKRDPKREHGKPPPAKVAHRPLLVSQRAEH